MVNNNNGQLCESTDIGWLQLEFFLEQLITVPTRHNNQTSNILNLLLTNNVYAVNCKELYSYIIFIINCISSQLFMKSK